MTLNLIETSSTSIYSIIIQNTPTIPSYVFEHKLSPKTNCSNIRRPKHALLYVYFHSTIHNLDIITINIVSGHSLVYFLYTIYIFMILSLSLSIYDPFHIPPFIVLTIDSSSDFSSAKLPPERE